MALKFFYKGIINLNNSYFFLLKSDFYLAKKICRNFFLFTNLKRKKAYWWNTLYSNNDFIFTASSFFIDAIFAFRKSGPLGPVPGWLDGNLKKGKKKGCFMKLNFIEGKAFNKELYLKCERPISPWVIKKKYAFHKFIYRLVTLDY